ncbi:hypothetical protein DPMN_150711 [Dreissena polymorpha]|uniref:Uncharacterized protein n=1 Tax=Dreissena polymorpha TaxID=45954 RepID=A0A9D4J2A9_DREPO|nr:hypothetical protein DPMN_150711 [Dreissena polymorpha]
MSDCHGTTPCTSGQECCSQKCSNGKEARKCAPDMRQCADVTAISQYAVQCMNFFGNATVEGITFDAYCSNLWGGLKCVAEKMMGTRPRYSTECVTRMALYLRLSPTVITDRLKQLLLIANIKQEYALNSTRCSENPLMTEPIPSRPGTGNKSACANPDTVVGYVTSGACKPPANTDVTEKNCQAFGAMLDCIAKGLVRDMGISDDGGLHRSLCVDTMTQMMSDSQSTLKRLFEGKTGGFDPKECVVHATVCGTGNGRPLEGRTCSGREACPSGYKCVDKYCCPEEKSGICPDFSGKRPPCNARCKKDSDCGSQEKCCNVGCNGGSTCVPLVSHNFSKCEREFDNAKQLLIVSGECGDGNSVLRIPKCENSRFAPMQGDIEKSRFYCVDEHGDKIAGSDHSDVVDCTKVNAGKCPAKPAVCANKASPDIYQCNDDSKCAAYQKCCMTELSNVCITGCVNVTQADAAVQEDCPNPVCCPITLCQDQVCAADVTATCRIQSCGQCSVKFYNKDGHVKDCEAGVPKCKVQRITARIANAKMKKTAGQKLGAFINSRLRKSNGSSAAMVDVMHTEVDVMETEGDLLDRLPDDPEMGMQHNERSVPKVDHFCNLLNKFAPCQRGNCSLGDPSRSVWQLCTCEPGYYGLLCEKNDTDQSKYLSRSPCERDRHSIDTIRSLLRNATTSRLSAVVAMYIKMRSADIRFLPEITCGSGLEFNATQRALLLPDRGVHISYCSNRTTGKPVPNTLVFAAESAGTLTRPDCNIIVQQDPLSLPQRCLFSKRQNCTSLNCGYFYDLTSQRCMKGAPTVHSFDSLTDCYETCSFSYKCNITNTPDYCTISSSPKPCQDTTGKSVCDYRKQFCHVSENSDMNMTQMGSCKDFPAFCLLNKSAGYHVMGVAKEPAYFYNATSRRCERFLYLGMGGNNNRFSSLHQCHTECGARAYKYDDVSCPLPTLLMESYPEIQEDVCDNDYGCPDGQVCCSNGMFHVCASPVKTCVGGGRCSLDGICDRGNCTCPECDTDAPLPVCGSDGTTYHSLCALHRRACQTMANITVAYYGACHREMCNGMQCKEYESCSNNTCACSNLCTMEYEPLCAVVPGRNIKRQFGNKCHLMSVACQTHTRYVVIRNGTCDFKTPVTCEAMCTSEYDPVCVLYPGTSGTPVTLPNMCHVDKCAENEASTRPHVLYSGECQGRCGANLTCQMYQQCVNGTCGCNSVCTKELRPVCAYAVNVPEQLKTFSNECEMRREGCLTATRYIIVEFGPCVKPAPKSDCPATRPDVPNSYSFSCRVETDAFCDRETEKCCPYGAGTRCVPRSSLIVRTEVKFGFCPRITPLTYDLSECHSDICGQDGDCAGMGKCCVNVVCGHSTCAVPEMPHAYENPQTTVCGADFTEIPDVECDPSVNASSCPVGSSCKRARIGEEAIGVCCSKMATDLANNPEIRARQTLCRLMEVVGIGCPGGRKCLGDLRGGRVCGVEDQGNCSIGIVQCVVNPCNVSTCSNYPTAKCTANYCGGCHAVYTMEGKDVTHLCNATLCQNERDFYEKLNNAGLMKTTTALQEINMFADHMRLALRMQGVHNIPSNGTIVCDSAGNYRPYQHYMNAKGEVHKLCVNTKTGVPYGRPDPEQPCDEHDNASRPELCSEKPDLVGTCDDSETERYYFNPDSASCEMYIDRGCNVMTPNSFNDLVACTSVCGGYGRSSPCAVMKCATGTHCVVNSGSAMCKALGENNGSGHLEPVCDKEGKFMKRQCYQGVCACVDPDTGSVTNATDCNKELPVGQATNNVDFSSCGPGISTKRIYCPNDGDGCNGCRIQTMSHPMEQCSKCQTCPTQSPPACGAQCNVTSVCKERPYALCRINKCDCTAEFVENGKVVTNCEKGTNRQ